METIIQAPPATAEDTLTVIREKMNKLNQMFDRIVRAEVYLKTLTDKRGKVKLAEIKLMLPGPDLFTSAKSHSFGQSFRVAYSKMRQALAKQKDTWFEDRV